MDNTRPHSRMLFKRALTIPCSAMGCCGVCVREVLQRTMSPSTFHLSASHPEPVTKETGPAGM